MSTKLGRNDPCHCGSGKKYKRCHLAADTHLNFPAPESSEISEPPAPPPDPRQLASFLKEMSRKGPQKDRAVFEELLAQTQPILAYLEHQEEIEAAATVLEAHREEFDRLVEDKEAYLARAEALFAEERFAPLRFTAADIHRAFESVGYPPNLSPGDQMFKTLLAAIMHLAAKERRKQIAMDLVLHLPHYVAAGRYLDGWLIQECAYSTGEVADQSNAFLFQMFSHGYDAWMSEQRARDEAILQDLGMDSKRLRGMSLDEIDAWLAAQNDDPAKQALMGALMQANPDQRALATANLEAMERDSINLLEREDACGLLLAPPEVEPWLADLNVRWAGLQDLLSQPSDDAPPDEATTKAVAEAIWPAVSEMAQSIFTPERIQQLIAQLKKYRSELFAAGDKMAAACALGAIASLEREDEPGQNRFLNALCLTSLQMFTGAGANSHPEEENSAPPAKPAS